ncbi:MAG: hypothetical protein KF730_13260 [Sphingomonas sp.]|uniref:hypothetical protein n=1 Tax=Sphingomonas sp. TaxID=28214 RepID=UPI0025D1D060|nr:hypothetical protein [Sphingomonas sp.]MBX3565531.1 hypothetical protein [Sphingomonas sp.]
MQVTQHAPRSAKIARQSAVQPAMQRAAGCCPYCGHAGETVIKRGAIVIQNDPIEVTWQGLPVPLSPTEAFVFRTIAVRGRATNQAIDEAMREFGSNPDTRPVVMMRIRRKFMALGSEDPFVRLGQHGVRLRIEADAWGSSSTVIGLSLQSA